MHVLLISTYDMGRQPFGLASPTAWLRAAHAYVTCVDTTRQRLTDSDVAAADLIAFHLPMHTATRLAVPIIERVRASNPRAHICCYGLYAPLNDAFLRSIGVETILGGEFEEAIVQLVSEGWADVPHLRALKSSDSGLGNAGARLAPSSAADVNAVVPRLRFLVPDRASLPPLERYATLQLPDGSVRVVGYTEASRGCKHLCRHCPIVPIYNGAFRIVQPEIVLEDVRRQVIAGARHITFGDPDFFNGIGHALAIVRALPSIQAGLTYDVTIKIEHLLRYRAHLAELCETGCLFVTSAVESVDDAILERLRKGHTRDDFERAAVACRKAGLSLRPTFVAFTPWTTLRGYCELLQEIARLDLVGEVAPIQLAIRLLIPEGSRLLDLPDVRERVGAFDAAKLAYPWRHDEPRVDALQEEVAALVAARSGDTRDMLFDRILALAHDHAGLEPPRRPHGVRPRTAVPFLNEPWYC